MPTKRIKHLIAAAGLAAVLVALAAALTLTSGAAPGPDPAKQRVEMKATLSPEQKIEQTGRKWARLFAAADPATCRYMTQPGCEQINCRRAPRTTIRNCTRPSSEFRKSFRDATVQDIAIKGRGAGARFSNGERVELFWVNGYAVGGVWWIHKVGGNAGRRFFLFDRASRVCGGFRRAGPYGHPVVKVEVVEGDVPCRVARRVAKDHYRGRDTGSWTCLGPEGLVSCERRLGVRITARF